MKRFTPLADGPGATKHLSLLAAACEGFWQCKACKHIGQPEEMVDAQDIAPPIRKCAECGHHFVKWFPPVLAG